LCQRRKIKEKDYRRRIFYGPRRRCTTKLVPPFGGTPASPSYYGGVPMQAWGSGAAIPPLNFAVPNVAFAEPYAHLTQPQQHLLSNHMQSTSMGGGAAKALFCRNIMEACEAREYGSELKRKHQVEGIIMQAKEWTRTFGRCTQSRSKVR
jgi:hypothetical protein